MFIFGFIVGTFAGAILISAMSVGKISDLQDLNHARTRALKRAENKAEELSKENKCLYQENKELRFENEEQKEFIDDIEKLATINTYNNDRAVLGKIIEVIQSAKTK